MSDVKQKADSAEGLREALETIVKANQEREWHGDPTTGGKGWTVRDGQYAKIARAALASQPEQPALAAVGVKPLEWQNQYGASSIGLYEIVPSDGRHYLRLNRETFDKSFGTWDEAKAACQADFERRVLSALTTPPPSPDVAALQAENERLANERDEAVDDAKFAERIAAKREVDANETTEALVAQMREALEPFADEAKQLASGIDDEECYSIPRYPQLGYTDFMVSDIRRAAAVLLRLDTSKTDERS